MITGRRAVIASVVVALLVVTAAPGASARAVSATVARAQVSPSACEDNTVAQVACHAVDSALHGSAAACRTPLRDLSDPSAPEACAVIDGRPVSPALMHAYEASWTHSALVLQRELGDDAPLLENQLLHTHNSFNASAYEIPAAPSRPGYYPTLTNQDPNQTYNITDQLDMDVRAIEMDVHWVPSPFGTAQTGGFWVTLCHGDSSNPLGVHIGCTIDRPFQDGLIELRNWLDAHPDQFVLLYLENQLSGNAQAHRLAGQLLQQYLGPRVDRPTTPCGDMDWNASPASVRSTGAQVSIVGNCGSGATNAWGAEVHERGPMWDEHGDPSAYSASQCRDDEAARSADTSLRRYFEDSTLVAAVAGSNPLTASLGGSSTISVATTRAMVRCGVNLIGFDQLTPQDPRLAASVWSWALGTPAAASGACALQGVDGRFHPAPCGERHPVACTSPDHLWHVSRAVVRWDAGARTCAREFPGSTFDVPRNGFRNQQLAASKAPGTSVWLGYHRVSGGWLPSSRPRWAAARMGGARANC